MLFGFSNVLALKSLLMINKIEKLTDSNYMKFLIRKIIYELYFI